jgi:hypothetical protein
VSPTPNSHSGNLIEMSKDIKGTENDVNDLLEAKEQILSNIDEVMNPTKSEAHTDNLNNKYVYTDHVSSKQQTINDNNKDVCNNHEISVNVNSNICLQNDSELNDNDDQSKSCVITNNVNDKHVTFKKLSLDKSVSNSLNEENEYIITDIKVNDIKTTCDIHDNNLISPRRNIGESKTRKTNSPRTKMYAGSNQNRSRNANETNSGSKRRRPSFQESLV